jgi:hypothetical protein
MQAQAVTTAWPLLNVHGVVEEVIHGQPIQY